MKLAIIILATLTLVGCSDSPTAPANPDCCSQGHDKSICGIPGQCPTCRYRVNCSLQWPHTGNHYFLCPNCILDPHDPWDD